MFGLWATGSGTVRGKGTSRGGIYISRKNAVGLLLDSRRFHLLVPLSFCPVCPEDTQSDSPHLPLYSFVTIMSLDSDSYNSLFFKPDSTICCRSCCTTGSATCATAS